MIRGIKTSGRWLLSVVLMIVISVALTAALNVWAADSPEIHHGVFAEAPYAQEDLTAVVNYKYQAPLIAGGSYVSTTEYGTMEAVLISFDGGSTYATDRGGCIYIQTVITGLSAGDIVEVDNDYFYNDGSGYSSYWDQAAYWIEVGDYTHNALNTINNWLIYIEPDGSGTYTVVIGSGQYNLAENDDDLTTIIGHSFQLTRDVKVYSGQTLSNPSVSSRGYTYSTNEDTSGWGTPIIDESYSTPDLTYVAPQFTYVNDDWAGADNGDIVGDSHVFGMDAFATIQQAIDGTADGGTVNIAAGTYVNDPYNSSLSIPESYRITKQITLLGAQAGVSPEGSVDRGEETILVRTNGTPYSLYASNIIIDGFTFTSGDGSGGGRIIVVGDNVVIQNCIIRDISGTDPHGLWIATDADNALIDNNTFSNTAWEAITCDGNAIISNNTIKNIASNKGINLSDTSDVTVTNNTISNTFYEGIFCAGEAIITFNDISSVYIGIQLRPSSNATVSNNVIYNTQYEGIAAHAAATVQDNEIYGCYHGIQIRNAASGWTIQGNNIHDNTYHGIEMPNYEGSEPVVTQALIENNTFAGNGGWGIYIGGAGEGSGLNITQNLFTGDNVNGALAAHNLASPVNATLNWWGDTGGPTHASNTYNIGQQGDAVSDNVIFAPWLDAAPPGGESFAPVTNGDNSYASIQAAIDDATAGDTINVAAGTYDENITVDKSLTINGAGAGDTTIDGDGSGVVVLITASNVTFQGFNVTGSGNNIQAHAGIVLQGVTGCTIENNTVSNNDANGIALAISSNNIIRNNATNNNGAWGIVVVNPGTNDSEATAMASTGNTFEGNTSNDNGAEGIYLDKRCNNNSVIDNTLSGNSGNGIHLYESHNNTITGNTISDNVLSGIYIKSHDNDVSENTITGNNTGNSSEHAGIYLKSGWIDHKSHVEGNQLLAENNSINHNNISGNNNAGVLYLENEYTYDDDLVIDATLNWWGDVSGPTHASNPDGNGDIISDNVNYEPWLGGSIEQEILGEDINYYIDSDGKILEEIIATSDDGSFTITIPEGTIALDESGEPLPGIDVSTGNGIDPPENAAIVGLIYNWGPEGATFDPYIIFEFHYDDEDIPSGFEEKNLVIMYYDSDAEEWVALETFVDTLNNVATAYVTHFTSFSLFSVEPEIVTTTIVSTTTDTTTVVSTITNTTSIVSSTTNTTTIIIPDNTITVTVTQMLPQSTVTQTMPQATVTQLLPGTEETVTLPVTITQTGAGATVTQTAFQTTAITTTQQSTTTATSTTTQTITQDVINWTITIVIAVIALLIGALLIAIIARRIQ